MNDHRAIIVGVCEATRTFQSNPVVYTLYSRAKQYVPMERKILSFILVQTGDERGRAEDRPRGRRRADPGARPAWGRGRARSSCTRRSSIT